MSEGNSKKQPPSLVRLCVWKAIDNVEYIGYVGGVDFGLLEQILDRCTPQQLMHIEDSTPDTDLSPVTAKLWKRYYEKSLSLGGNKRDDLVEEFKRYKDNNQWRKLYEAKMFKLKQFLKEITDKHHMQKLKDRKEAANDVSVYNPYGEQVKKRRMRIQKSFGISPPGLSANAPSTSRSNPCG